MLCVALLPGIVVGATLVDVPSVEAISGTNALVRWTTDVATGGRVRYGTELSNLTQGAEGDVRAQLRRARRADDGLEETQASDMLRTVTTERPTP